MEPALLKRDKPRDEHGELLSDQWETPRDIYEEICERMEVWPVIDVCAAEHNTKCKLFIDRKTDALKTDWVQFAFERDLTPTFYMNPPYSQNLLGAFVQKAYEEASRGAIVLALLPASVSTNWYHKYIAIQPESRRQFLRGRIAFKKHPLMDQSKKDAPSGGNLVVLFLPVHCKPLIAD